LSREPCAGTVFVFLAKARIRGSSAAPTVGSLELAECLSCGGDGGIDILIAVRR